MLRNLAMKERRGLFLHLDRDLETQKGSAAVVLNMGESSIYIGYGEGASRRETLSQALVLDRSDSSTRAQ